jgi:predicted dehydrogenase
VTGHRIVEVGAFFSTHQPKRLWTGRAGEGPPPRGRVAGAGGIEVDVALEEQADLLVRFENGAAGAVTISAVSPGNPNNLAIAADGASGGFDWCQQSPNTYNERLPVGIVAHQRAPELLPRDLEWMSSVPAGHAEGYVDAFRNVVRRCWLAMRGESIAYPGFADGLRGLSLVEAAVASATEKRPVAVE